ncbi:hypothetical protein [Burkholderia cenocepacia]|uniref:hypothetical protein n=1 Tax=Burkholderia cenocepacia TaxID=95486 RepID=UPI000F5A0330|nr:hypothetical protein [Burkholderia cenocepacia]RQU83921.1 hypothetical protein DF040_33920 [Burkholderia cenocepacia]
MTMNAFRDLHEIRDEASQSVVARITAGDPVAALRRYLDNGGKIARPFIALKQVSYGYPCDVLEIYA